MPKYSPLTYFGKSLVKMPPGSFVGREHGAFTSPLTLTLTLTCTQLIV